MPRRLLWLVPLFAALVLGAVLATANTVHGTTGAITTVAGGGPGGPNDGDGGPATNAVLWRPEGVAAGETALYIADFGHCRVRQVSGGVIGDFAGNGICGFGGDGGPATGASLQGPEGIAVDASGSVYIADTANCRVRKVSGGIITTVAGSGPTLASIEGCASSGDGGLATSATLNQPTFVAVDGAGTLYITDGASCRVRKVAGGIITTVAGTGVCTSTGDGGAATGATVDAGGIAVDNSGNNLYIADFSGCSVRRVTGGIITTVVGNGTCAYGGDGGPATNANLYFPAGITLGGDGALYIADRANCRVRQVAGGIINTVAGNGTCTYAGDGGPATSASVNRPAAVAVDTSCDLYVADTFNNVVRAVNSVSNCTPATPTPTNTSTPTMTPMATATPRVLPTNEYFVALDCGNGPGVDCDVYAGPLDVSVKFGNPAALGAPVNVGEFNFNIYNPNAALLGVGVGTPVPNPAFVSMTSCDTPPADDDTAWWSAPGGKTFGPGTTDSFLSCLVPEGYTGDSMPSGSTTSLGTVHYNVAPAANSGTVPLTLWAVAVHDGYAFPLVSCESTTMPPAPPVVPDPGSALGQCINVTINVLTGPSPTPTSTPTATNTPCPDVDCDGVPDVSDNCVSIANPSQANRNSEIVPLAKPMPPFDDTTNIIGDNVGDACEPDIDHDGAANATESGLGLSPYIADTDGDRTNDGTEIACGSDPLNALSKLAGTDTDHDSVPDACEVIYGTDPNNIDSDGDRLLDGWEVRYWMSNALSTNTDADGCTDEREVASVNNDSKVNSTDMLMLAQRFGSITPEWGDLDMNGDGRINSTDMLFVSQHFGQCRGV